MDDELEKIKRKRMEELKRKVLIQKIKDQASDLEPKSKPPKLTNKMLLDRYFKGRAWEVYNAAKNQYPQIIPQVEKVLLDGIQKGKIKEAIDGANLFQFFRRIGIPVRLNTKIRIADHGELKTIEQVLKEKE
jgi:DNA-binding TFAR19-related protein (PDSD5 family)